MRRSWSGAVGLAFGALVMTACGAGGFGSGEPAEPDRTVSTYVALGDGFTAAPYVGDIADHVCRRSRSNYPSLVAEELHVEKLRDVSCTGATTGDIGHEHRPSKGTPEVAAQIGAVRRDTDLVTLGVGIEDHDLLRTVFKLCVATPCARGTVDAHEVVADLDASAATIISAVRAVQAKAPSAYVVLVGYPRILPSVGGCGAFPKLKNQVGLDAANYVLDYLNRRIQSVARETGASYVDMAGISTGHELCSPDPWVTGMRTEPGASVAYHPVRAEQRAVAAQLAAMVRTR